MTVRNDQGVDADFRVNFVLEKRHWSDGVMEY